VSDPPHRHRVEEDAARDQIVEMLRLAGTFLTALAIVKEIVLTAESIDTTRTDQTRKSSHNVQEALDRLPRNGVISENQLHALTTAIQYSEGLGYDLCRLLIEPRDQLRAELAGLINSLDGIAQALEAPLPPGHPPDWERVQRAPRVLLGILSEQIS